jgi:hypothetical protein
LEPSLPIADSTNTPLVLKHQPIQTAGCVFIVKKDDDGMFFTFV